MMRFFLLFLALFSVPVYAQTVDVSEEAETSSRKAYFRSDDMNAAQKFEQDMLNNRYKKSKVKRISGKAAKAQKTVENAKEIKKTTPAPAQNVKGDGIPSLANGMFVK